MSHRSCPIKIYFIFNCVFACVSVCGYVQVNVLRCQRHWLLELVLQVIVSYSNMGLKNPTRGLCESTKPHANVYIDYLFT